MSNFKLTLEEKYRVIATNCGGITLNGNTAGIGGTMEDFATITDLTTGLSCQFAWLTVKHIIENKNGNFKS